MVYICILIKIEQIALRNNINDVSRDTHVWKVLYAMSKFDYVITYYR